MDIIAVLTLAAAAAVQQPVPPVGEPAEAILVLPAGTTIELMVLREVDSDRAKPGDPVKLRVNSPVTIGEQVVVPVGTAAQGEVAAATKSGALMQRGNLTVNITSITLQGQTIALGTEVQQKGRGGKSDDALKAMLAPMWVLFARGNSAKLKAGELFQAQVEQDICFAPRGGSLAAVPCPQAVPPIAPVPAG